MIRAYSGISLDGFSAMPDGLPVWDAMPSFSPDSYGLPELEKDRAAIVMGRTSFDQGFKDWLPRWPWPDNKVFVLTSRPLPKEVPDGVLASSGGPADLVKQLQDAKLDGDVQVLGGPRTIQAFMEVGALERLELCVLPILLGKGIPMFDIESNAFSTKAWAAAREEPSKIAKRTMRLESHRAFPDGAVELVYSPE